MKTLELKLKKDVLIVDLEDNEAGFINGNYDFLCDGSELTEEIASELFEYDDFLNCFKAYIDTVPSIDKSALTTDLDFSVYAESIAKLCNVSELERTYHIRHNDDRMLSSILKNPHS